MKVYTNEEGNLVIDGEGVESVQRLDYHDLPANTKVMGFNILNEVLAGEILNDQNEQ